jgi:hypothetical protein
MPSFESLYYGRLVLPAASTPLLLSRANAIGGRMSVGYSDKPRPGLISNIVPVEGVVSYLYA